MKYNFCNFLNGYAGTCGCPVPTPAERCLRHEKLAQKKTRDKIGKYSGPSKLRKEDGYKK